MPQLGVFELLIIFVIFLIFFGAGKLGNFGGAIRKGIDEFKTNAGWGDSDKPDKGPNQSKPLKG
jgi:Sec-independent protein translocase protein TatA